MVAWAGYKQAKAHGTIGDMLSSTRAKTIQENRDFLKSISKVAVLCARQDIGLRGHREHETSMNKGNFLEILELVASESSILKKRIKETPRNAKYTSKTSTIQNDLLKSASDVILEQIVAELNQSRHFSIIADESRDISRMEQLSLCLRYVHPQDHTVKERFVGFTDCHELDASSLAQKIMDGVERLGIDIKKCIAQCYDGASVMSGQSRGVQKKIRDVVGRGCIYVHCYAHRINLVVVSTASRIEKVKDFFGLMEAVYRFINVSSLRHSKFIDAQKERGLTVMEIPKLSDTRWVCRYSAVRLYKERFGSLLKALEMICIQSKDGCEKAECTGLLTQLRTFSFVLLLWVFEDILGITKLLSDTLQSKNLDLAKAIDLVDSVSKTLTERRSLEYFNQIWHNA